MTGTRPTTPNAAASGTDTRESQGHRESGSLVGRRQSPAPLVLGAQLLEKPRSQPAGGFVIDPDTVVIAVQGHHARGPRQVDPHRVCLPVTTRIHRTLVDNASEIPCDDRILATKVVPVDPIGDLESEVARTHDRQLVTGHHISVRQPLHESRDRLPTQNIQLNHCLVPAVQPEQQRDGREATSPRAS